MCSPLSSELGSVVCSMYGVYNPINFKILNLLEDVRPLDVEKLR